MADNAYDRTIINPLERPLSSDINQLQGQIDRAIRDTLRRLFQISGTPQSGFLDTGFSVVQNSPAGMSVLIKAGIGFQDNTGDVPTSIGGIAGLNDLSPYKPLPLVADMTINIDTAPGAGQERYDIIEVIADRRGDNPLSRDVLNVGTGIFAPSTLDKTLDFTLDGQNGRVVSPASSTTGVGYKVGVAAAVGTATVPATTTGYIAIATIYVGPSVTSIVTANITDRRSIVGPTPGAGTVGTSQLAAGAVTRAKEAAVGQQISASSGNFTTSSTTPVAVTNLSVTITTTGRPVVVALVGDAAGLSDYVGANSTTTANPTLLLALLRGATTLNTINIGAGVPAAGTTVQLLSPPPGVLAVDPVTAGTYTYSIKASVNGAGVVGVVEGVVLVAYEL